MATVTDAYVSFLQGINTRSFPRLKSRTSSAHSQPPGYSIDSSPSRCQSQESFVDLDKDYQDIFRRSSSLPSLDQVDAFCENGSPSTERLPEEHLRLSKTLEIELIVSGTMLYFTSEADPALKLKVLQILDEGKAMGSLEMISIISDVRNLWVELQNGYLLIEVSPEVKAKIADILNSRQSQESTSEAVKNRVRGWWANMKYGWNAMNAGAQIDISDLSGADPIYLLGQVYHNKNNSSSFRNFFADFSTRIWFTYRQDFQPMQSTGHTSDSGWGCMLRSAQMILAEAFVFHLLGRQWRWSPKHHQEHGVHRKIIKWFSDDPDPSQAPFSVHNMVKAAAAQCGKKAGDWFGPSTAAYLLKKCLEEAAEKADSREIFEQMAIYVAQDCTIYIQDVLDLCTNDPNIEWKSLVILIPVRLGGENVNVNYIHSIKEILAYQNCLGIIGGKPRHSLYFVGFQGHKLVYLDPHYLQKTANMSKSDFSLNSFHCTTARKVSFSKLDPSATIGFYCKTRRDFENFKASMRSVTETGPQNFGYPVFIINDGSSALVNQFDSSENSGEKVLRVHRHIVTAQGTVRRESEEYVVL